MPRILLLKTARDLARARAQSLALILVVALGITSFISLIGAYRDLDTSYTHTYDELAFADADFSVAEAPESVLAQVAGIDGVAAVTGRLVINTGFELPNGDPIRARLIGLPADGQPDVNKLFIRDGRMLAAGDDMTVVIEANFADFYGVQPGDRVTPIVAGQTASLAVVGVANSPEYLIVSPSQQDIFPSARTFAVLFLPLSQLQSLTDAPQTLNNVTIRIAPDANRAAVVDAVQQLLAPYTLAATVLQEDNPSNAALQQDLAGYREIAYLMPALILLVAGISVYIMLGRLVRSQQPQIGLMAALGYRRRAILGHYLTFALMIGLCGVALGVLAGIPLSRLITTGYASELGIPLVETRFYADLTLGAVGLSLVLSLVAGMGPARGSSQLSPAEAMRLDPAVARVDGRPSRIERLVRLPLWLRLPLRNVFRLRRRSLATGLGIVFAFMLVLMVWAMFDSMNLMFTRSFEDIERWDIAVVFDTLQPEGVLNVVEGWDGVITAEPNFQLPVTLQDDRGGKSVLLTALAPGQQLHQLQLPSGLTAEAALGHDQVVLTTATADEMGLQPGDTVRLETPYGQEVLQLGGTTSEMMSAVAYVSLPALQERTGSPVPLFNGLFLTVRDDRAQAVKNLLYHLPGAASVQLKADIAQDLRSLLGLFYVFMGMMMAFALAMAFALLFNAMTVNVLERQRELATMRALGAGRRSIAAQLSLENGILWLLALAPGLLLGTWTAVELGRSFSAELFVFDIHIAPLSYVATALGILATMLLATLPAVRRVNRLNLAEATKVLT